MVAVINVDTYSLLTCSDMTCHPDDTGIGVLLSHGVTR